jgi:hypothetical protein
MLRRRIALSFVCVSALFRCVGDTSTPTDAGPDVTTSDGAPDVVQNNDAGSDASASSHVYAASFGPQAQAALVVFDVPLSNASQPVAVLTTGFKTPSDVEIFSSSGNTQLLVVDPGVQKLFIYNTPVTSSSSPVVTIPTPGLNPFDAAFDSKGNLWLVGTSGLAARYAPPFSASSQPAQTFTIPNATLGSFSITFNKLDGIFAGSTATNQTAHVYAEATPFDAGVLAPMIDNTKVDTPTGMVFNANGSGFFVSDQIHGIVDAFVTPLMNTTVPTAVGASALAAPTRLVFNASGNLVVADAMKGIVILAAPDFNTAPVTVPSQFGDAAATTFSYRSVAIGP